MLDEEALRQFAYLSSLLAGFSVMVTVSLLSLKDERRIVGWVIGVMILASVLFLTSTSIAAMYFIVPSDWLNYLPSEVPSPQEIGFDFLDAIAAALAAFTYIGTLAFSFGVALLGWIRSRLVGLISTISALLFVLIFNLFVAGAGLLLLRRVVWIEIEGTIGADAPDSGRWCDFRAGYRSRQLILVSV